MRSFISIAMAITGIATALTGLQAHVGAAPTEHHMATALLFTALAGIHVWLNRIAMTRRVTRLGWRWVWVGLGSTPFILVMTVGRA